MSARDLLVPSEALQGYYRWHARIYDWTRWSFLYGRNRVLVEAANALERPPQRILEIGCGTGRNLARLAKRFPDAELVGVDLSPDMLAQARQRLQGRRVHLVQAAYPDAAIGGAFDLVLLSYTLTMVGPGAGDLLDAVARQLGPAGRIAAVDFRDSRWSWFRRWMRYNHVDLNDRTLPLLRERFEVCGAGTHAAPLWRWYWFTGRAAASASE